ncbi:MAG: AsmA family protein, partial [Marinobacter sp.]|uniref:AsmA family protein n=1 Tax=Marinobacter sp. TaxID=50741 RepID=UPI003C63C894
MDSLIKATRTRKVIAGVLVLAALLVLAAVLAAWLLIDRDRIAQRLEARLSASSGMEVQIRKPLQLGLLPKPSVTIAGLEVSHQGQAVATVESISVVFATAPLLTGNLQPVDLHIRQPQLTVTRNKDGKFNLYRPDPGQLGTFSLPRLRVTDARLSYHDLATDREWLMEQCDLNLHTLHHGGGAMEEV